MSNLPLIPNQKQKSIYEEELMEELKFQKRLTALKEKIRKSEKARIKNPEKFWRGERYGRND